VSDPSESPTLGRSKKVLLVEDERITQALTRRWLEDHGYTVVATGNGNLVVGLVAAEKPDVVLLDLGLETSDPFGGASFDGFTVMEWLRRQDLELHPPIIVLTGRTEPDLRERVLDAGAVAFLQKPADRKVLLQAIQVALEDIPERVAASKRKKILLVEDEALTQAITGRWLTEQGYAVTTTGNGDAVPRLLQTEKPDLILLDLGLDEGEGDETRGPGETIGADGFAIMQWIRRMQAPRKPSIIVLTGRYGPELKKQVLEAGAVAFLQKPAHRARLMQAIRIALEEM
jgi:CheY-like chemotaxis protein